MLMMVGHRSCSDPTTFQRCGNRMSRICQLLNTWPRWFGTFSVSDASQKRRSPQRFCEASLTETALPTLSACLDQDGRALKGRKELAPLLRYQDILFQADEARGRHHAQLQREHVARLDRPLHHLAVAWPARSQQRPPIVDRTSQTVTHAMLVLRIACVHHDAPGRGIDLMPQHARP